jgi:iron complex outermembrane recepter protein
MHKLNNSQIAHAVAQATGRRPATTLLVGCAVLLAAGNLNAAQTEDGKQVEEVIVTGYRASLESSIAEKLEGEQILEAISAEDIGKLPDNSIAESIARAPGLTTQRLDGRAQVISIRGLAPDFSNTLLNGREQVTTGDNRAAEYDQYPSELLQQVVVYKTPSANLIGQGLSGTVDLQTVRPLEHGRRTYAASVRGESLSLGKLNAGSEDTGYRVSGTYIDQFANDTIGIALGVAYMDSPTQIERFNAWGYPTVSDGGPRVIGGAKPYVISTELKRTGVIGTFEFQPTQSLLSTLDVYYSKFEDDQLLRGIEFPLFWSAAQLQDQRTVVDGMIVEGQFNNVKPVVRNDANKRDAEMWSMGWHNELEVGAWNLVADASYSSVERTDIILESYAGTGRGPIGVTDELGFSMSGSGVQRFSSILDYADPNLIFLTSPQGWGGNAVAGGQDGFINSPSTEDELKAFKLSAQRELGGMFESVEFGANYTTRDKDYGPNRFYLGLKANAADPEHDLSVPIPASALRGSTRLGFLGIPGMVSYDPLALVYDSGLYNFLPATDADAFSRNWNVGEDVLTGFAMLNIRTELGAKVLSGNIGVQFIQTDQESGGTGAVNPPAGSPVGTPATIVPVLVKQDYTNTLPSLNLSLRLQDDLVLRLGAGRQLARPRLDEMKASIAFGYNSTLADSTDINSSPWSGSGGNPKLRPWIADAVDLSIEKYFARDGYVAAAVFYKDLQSYIFNQQAIYDFTGFPVTGGPEPALRQGLVSIPQNGKGGEIYGYEASVAVPFSLMSDTLEGFGLTASYSFTKSNVQPNPGDPSQPLPGLSEDVLNSTLYYEREGFSARVSARYRSEFLGEVQGVGAERLLRTAKAETLVDAQIGYEFQEGSLEGLSLLLQGSNLTDEPFVTFQANDERQVIDHQTFGRRYLFGASYKY